MREIYQTLERLRLILAMLITPGLSEDVDSICFGKLNLKPSSALVGLSRYRTLDQSVGIGLILGTATVLRHYSKSQAREMCGAYPLLPQLRELFPLLPCCVPFLYSKVRKSSTVTRQNAELFQSFRLLLPLLSRFIPHPLRIVSGQSIDDRL